MHCWTHPISKMGVILSVSWCKCVQVKKRRAPTLLVLDCSVCSAPAPDHLHFGGHCCYSCRAFFRRTIQRMEKIDVVCRWVLTQYLYSFYTLSTYIHSIRTLSTHYLSTHVVFRTGTGDCEVSETSKSCSACRFEKCLQVGMKRELLQVFFIPQQLLSTRHSWSKYLVCIL